MIDLRHIPMPLLKEAVSKLSKHLGKKIDIVGHTKLDLVKLLSYEVEQLLEEEQNVLPELCQEMYNFIYQDEDISGKKFKPKLLKKINKWGTMEGTQAYILDEMIQAGGFTLQEMARACCSTLSRVKNHMTGRKNQYNFHFVIYNGKYYMKPNEEKNEYETNKKVVRSFDF